MYVTSNEENVTGKKCCESRKNYFASFKQKFVGIECCENLKIKILREFNVLNCCKRGKMCLKMHLI